MAKRLLEILESSKKLTEKEKLAIAKRTLEVYANIDLWSANAKHYDVFNLNPPQDGWNLAQLALKKINYDSRSKNINIKKIIEHIKKYNAEFHYEVEFSDWLRKFDNKKLTSLLSSLKRNKEKFNIKQYFKGPKIGTFSIEVSYPFVLE